MSGGNLKQNLESDLGLFSEPFKTPAVPKAFMKTMKSNEEFFDDQIKKNRGTIKDDLIRSAAKISKKARQSKSYKDAEKKRNSLENLFKNIYVYYKGAEQYYTGCIGVEKIKEYNKKIEGKTKKLIQKGDLTLSYLSHANFRRFHENNKYALSFVNDCQPPKTNNIYLKKFDAYMPYKSRCELLYSYLQTLFSTCLSAIDKAYNEVLEQNNRPQPSKGTCKKFEDTMKRLYDANYEYEKCVSEIKEETQKHNIFYNLGKNKYDIQNMYSEIDNISKSLESMISAAKRVTLNVEFISVKKESMEEYENLMRVLESINSNLNNISNHISKGDYESFERDYRSVVDSLNSIPEFVKEFKTIKYREKVDFDKELKNYEASLSALAQKTENMVTEFNKFTEKLKQAFLEFQETLARESIASAIKMLVQIALLVTPFSKQTSTMVSEFSKEFNKLTAGGNLPHLTVKS